MPAAAKRKTAKPAPRLELHSEPFSDETHHTYGEFVVSVRHPLDAELRVYIPGREQNIARGLPIEGSVHIPNYEKVDPSSDWERVPVHVDQLENLGLVFLALAAEAKRLGILPPPAKTEG